MLDSLSLNPATELERVAAALNWTLHRDDWWGPARLAFDTEIDRLRRAALEVATDLRSLP
jgi:hypothetical protein